MDHIGLRSVRNLEVLDLSNNGLRKVSSSPLRGLDWLVELKLDDNRICKIQGEPFSSMPRLRVLSMRNNRMATLPEISFKTLRGNIAVLDLDGNPLDCSCDMLWLRSWLEAESNNPGPRCRDGSMLRESRISRSECQYDGRNNQVPLTNEHGDIFFRNNDFDECENEALDELQNQLPPSPEESEYFYDTFVDFPFNETHLGITNVSVPISLPPPVTTQKQFPSGLLTPPQNSINRNATLLNFHNLPQRPPPTSPFTFFGVPLPALSLGNLWGNGSGRDVRNRAAGTGSRGKGRVQIYRPDDPEIQKFLQNPTGRYPDAEHRHRLDTGLNVGEIEGPLLQQPIPQDDNSLFHRPYFQTPFMKPNVEKGGFIPMLPGSGGFTPINDPFSNYTNQTNEDPPSTYTTRNTNQNWPDDFPDLVPVVTEASSIKKYEYTTPQNHISIQNSDASHDEKSAEYSNRLDYITRPTATTSSSTTTSTTTTTTTTTTPITRVPTPNYRNRFPEIMTSSEESIHTTNVYPQIPETIEPSRNPSTTPMTVREKPSQPSTTQSQPPPNNVIDYSTDRRPPNYQSDLWENQNSPSSLSALVAPGAQQNLFRNTPPGRSTITKIATPIPPPSSPTAQEYHRVTKHDRYDDFGRQNIDDETVTMTVIENITPKKKEDMEWYFANYNRTPERFEPGLNSLKSSATSNGLSFNFRKIILALVTILVIVN